MAWTKLNCKGKERNQRSREGRQNSETDVARGSQRLGVTGAVREEDGQLSRGGTETG